MSDVNIRPPFRIYLETENLANGQVWIIVYKRRSNAPSKKRNKINFDVYIEIIV